MKSEEADMIEEMGHQLPTSHGHTLLHTDAIATFSSIPMLFKDPSEVGRWCPSLLSHLLASRQLIRRSDCWGLPTSS